MANSRLKAGHVAGNPKSGTNSKYSYAIVCVEYTQSTHIHTHTHTHTKRNYE